ncbi:MAG: cardiolipin synthase [Pirellulaceae bacterium]|nr:cardiolipin synthase [Pirellulaceae bacterium]
MQLIVQLQSLAIWAFIDFGISLIASAHVVLNKRNVRATVAWVGIIWLAPFLGTTLYLLLGINRIERHARRKRPQTLVELEPCQVPLAQDSAIVSPSLRDLNRLGETISGLPLTAGNAVQVLVNGDEAYPAMLSAIDQAQRTITLATYIFDRDFAGKQFVQSLGAAVQRGVKVRVLVDMVGASYRWPTIRRSLVQAGVPVAYFLPTLVPWRLHYSNLRNHRKMLIVDGSTAFTGGMNIREGNLLKRSTRNVIRDLHFCISGPVVGQLQEIFAIDWRFTTDEVLSGPDWFRCAAAQGPVAARCIADGPDEDLDRMRKLLHGALSVARQSISIVTPYFLPDDTLITALNVASMRGIQVDIYLPERGNLRFVQWASTAQLWQVLEHGTRIWLTPPPFDHTKLMLVDDEWALIGSTNWDPRSLRLNFEINVELYCRQLASDLKLQIEQRRAAGRQLTLREVNERPLWQRLRDGVARLLSPYL